MSDVKNPCIDLCKFDEDVCRGCGRTKAETKGWKKLANSDKKVVVNKARKRLEGLKDAGRRKKT